MSLISLYQYHPTRSGDVARAFLGDFVGYVQTDGFSGYDFLDHAENIRHIGCWAHARRKFMDVVTAQEKNRKTGAADAALSFISKLYKLEKEARAKGLSPEEMYQMRQSGAKPILADFHQWLTNKSVQTPPKGLLGIAVSYTLKQWDRLIGYIEDGRLALDNNGAENAIRPFVVGLDRSTIMSLALNQWVKSHHNILVTGPTGVGKSYLACALAQKACRDGHTTLYQRVPRLFQELALSRQDGRFVKLFGPIIKCEVLILDDLLISPMTRKDQREILEIVEDNVKYFSHI